MLKVQEKFKSLPKKLQRALRRDAQRHGDAGFRQRCKIVVNLAKGRSRVSIAEHLHCSDSTIGRVAQRFVQQGPPGLVDHREDNGDVKISEKDEAFLLQAAAGSPQDYGYDRPTWTLELFMAVLEEHSDVTVSSSTMSRTLARLGIRCKRPKPIVLCPWKKAARTRKLNAIKRLLSEVPADEVIVFADEVDIHLNPKIGPDWMPCGVQKTVLTPGQNEKRYLAGALNARTGEVTYVEGRRKDSQLFIAQLWQLVRDDYPQAKRIHIVLDNYRIHKSGQTQTALDALADKVTLHFLPPYCPDHNKIERLWRDLHAEVTRNHRCATIDELMIEVRNYLDRRNNQQAQNRAA